MDGPKKALNVSRKISQIKYTRRNILFLWLFQTKKIVSYVIHESSINSDKYMEFIKSIMYMPKYNKYTLLMDNASINKTKTFIKYTSDNNLSVLYNISYNPETNPIEMLFSPLKNHIRSNKTNTLGNIKKSIDEYIVTTNGEHLEKLFTKALG